jgi:hypothetical protein
MQTTGRKTRSVFERYNIVNECDLLEAVKKLNTPQPVQAARLRRSYDGRPFPWPLMNTDLHG